jgi:hypothetical protein
MREIHHPTLHQDPMEGDELVRVMVESVEAEKNCMKVELKGIKPAYILLWPRTCRWGPRGGLFVSCQ